MTADKLIPARAIEEKIEELRAERRSLEGELERVKHEIFELAEAEAFYKSVLDMAVEPGPNGPRVPEPPQKLPPSDAVLNLVRQEPGIKRMVAVDRLEDRIQTESDDRRHLLRNTIYGLVDRGKLVRTEEDRLYPPGQESEHGEPDGNEGGR